MNVDYRHAIWLGFGSIIVFAFAVLVAFSIGRCSGPTPIDPIDMGIDAGPGEREIEARLDAAVQREQERLEEIDRAHETEIAQFDAQQREKYEALQAQGPDAVSQFIVQFNRRLRDSGVR